MTTHSKTTVSFAEKSEQYLKEDCSGLPFAQHFAVTPLLYNVADKAVLCVGCGAGTECRVLAELGAVVSGIDPSPALLEVAQTNCPSGEFIRASAEEIPFPDRTFDMVYCAHVLHYINDWGPPLREMHRVLKVGGRAIVTIHHPLDYGLIEDQRGKRILGFDNQTELGDYLTHREVHATWYRDFDVVYYPRSIAEMLNTFIKAGFHLKSSIEAGETPQSKLPLFVAFELSRS